MDRNVTIKYVIVLLLILRTGVLCEDVPCFYDGSEFLKMDVADESEYMADEVIFANPIGSDRDYYSLNVPKLSEPASEIKSKIDLIKVAVEPENTIVHNKAVELAAKSPGIYNIGQICFIDNYLRDNWRYVPDPRGKDKFSPASNTINLGETISIGEDGVVAGAGDCDDYAILMASLLESISGTTRIILAYGKGGGHAYTEVYIGPVKDESTKKAVNWLKRTYKCDVIQGHLAEEDESFWLNLDWNGTHPGGSLYSSERQSFAYIGDIHKKTKVNLPPAYSLQMVKGTLSGKVTDKSGYPLACTIVATDIDSGKDYPYSVNDAGTFKFDIPPGDYEITAEKPGYIFSTEQRMVLEDTTVSVDIEGSVRNQPNIQFQTEATDTIKRCVYYTRNDEGRQVFKIRIYVIGPDLDKIRSVKYSLHETFENPDHISTDASKNFEMTLWAWGRSPMPITVTTKDGNEYRYMYSFTFRSQLEEAQRKGYRFVDATYAWDVIGGY